MSQIVHAAATRFPLPLAPDDGIVVTTLFSFNVTRLDGSRAHFSGARGLLASSIGHAMLHYVTHQYQPPGRRATYDDLRNAPDNLVAEILDGILYTSPRPAPAHAKAHSKLLICLAMFDEDSRGPGGWDIFTEPEVHFGEDVLVPDLGGWRVGRDPMSTTTAYFTIVPDWVCEVLSPSTASLVRLKKLHVYAQHGVRHVWLVDPIARALEVFELSQGAMVLRAMYRDDERVRAVPFDAVEIALPRLWPSSEAIARDDSQPR